MLFDHVYMAMGLHGQLAILLAVQLYAELYIHVVYRPEDVIFEEKMPKKVIEILKFYHVFDLFFVSVGWFFSIFCVETYKTSWPEGAGSIFSEM